MKRIRKTLDFPDDLIKEIEQFMKDNYMTTFTSAVIELIRRGLNNSK